MRSQAAAGVIILLAAVTAEAGEILGIKPDPRAVESGVYIRPAAPATRSSVAFTVTEPTGISRRRWPVRGSLPFYRGELASAKNIRLIEGARERPVQASTSSSTSSRGRRGG